MTTLQLPPNANRGHTIDAVTWAGFGISAVFVAARVFTRIYISKAPGWDDFWLVFSMALRLIAAVVNSVAVHEGLGRHMMYLTQGQISNMLYYSAIVQPIIIASYILPKLAVMILITKFMGPHTRGKWFLYSVMTTLFATHLLCIIFIYAQCDPPNHFWHPTEPAKCMDLRVLLDITYVASAWAAFTDLSLALFPITFLWNLQMKLRKKIQIMSLMGMGVFASIAAVIKTSVLGADVYHDATWTLYGLIICTNIESSVVIMCASLPVLPQLLLWLKDKDVSRSGSRQKLIFAGAA